MCGITALISKKKIDVALARSMTESLLHRGPDSQGIATALNGKIYLESLSDSYKLPESFCYIGHSRLSIIDTTSAGFQPLVLGEKGYAISYNGEIYNYKEIRNELETIGFRFKSSSDTEVLLNAYIAWGEKCVDKFNGVWSFCILDISKNRLIVSRDRLGVKPLYTYKTNECFYFASEIKAIKHCLKSLIPDEHSISDYLNLALVDHTRHTFYNSIDAFAPGTIQTIDLDSLEILTSSTYWSPSSFAFRQSEPKSLSEAGCQVLDLFQDSVRLRLRSDVPIGASLSGGIDSSAVVCMIKKLLDSNHNDLHTFTACPSEAHLSEQKWADIVSNHTNAIQYNVTIPPIIDPKRIFIDQLLVQDQPFTSSSIYAQFLVMQRAHSEGIKVLLDGQGADEVFCGYRKYVIARSFELLRDASPLQLLFHSLWILKNGDLGILRLKSSSRYFPNFIRQASKINTICTSDGHLSQSLSSVVAKTSLHDLQKFDLSHLSLPSLLRYNDHNSMANSVEGRNPFLDYRLVELGLNLSSQYKIYHGKTKAVLREAFSELVPSKVMKRRNKMGFAFSELSLMKKLLFNEVEKSLSPLSPVSQYISPPTRKILCNTWTSGAKISQSMSSALFRIYLLNCWLESSL